MREEDLAKSFAATLEGTGRKSTTELPRVWKLVLKHSFRKNVSARSKYKNAFDDYLEGSPKRSAQDLFRSSPNTSSSYGALREQENKRFTGTLSRLQKKLAPWHWQEAEGIYWTLDLHYQGAALQLTAKRAEPPKTDDQGADQAAHGFYSAVAGRDFATAWQGLSVAYQQRRWPSGIEQFKDGYHYLRAVQELQVVPRTKLQETAVIDAFFEEKKEVPAIPALNVWQSVTFADAQRIPKLLQDLYQFLSEFGVDTDRLNMMKFRELFHTDAADAIRWELGISGPMLSQRYAKTDQHNYRVARRLYLNRVEGCWLIERINWLST